MEDLLRNDFTAHYSLPASSLSNFVIETNDIYFEIEDGVSREIVIHNTIGQGMARFSNPNVLLITIANYDKFLTSLPNSFQRDRGRCDIIVCDPRRCFILGEIKESINIKRNRKNAKKLLFESLNTLIEVPQIQELINRREVKRCCYFNKQTNAPEVLTATTAFNRLSTLFPEGFKMNHPDFEAQNFEFWEYLGGQTLTIN
ncbi:MAG: hypothetical protein EBS07_11550 [Sphingobacteriia bacterium]|nr:hypothetical protein [Sphingobacteriia bacterium]